MSGKDLLKVPVPTASSGPRPGGLAPPPNSVPLGSSSATGNPRNKVALRPGYSLMDWIKLTKSGKDLAGTGGKVLQVTKSELKKHNKRSDAWLALNGIVYNVTAYMDFHPGGWDELIRGAGKDATILFNKYHQWVNYESMLSACLVGKLVPDYLPPPPPSTTNTDSKLPVIPPIVANTGPEKPKLDLHQADETLTLSIFTRRKKLIQPEHIIIDYLEPDLIHILLRLLDDQTAYNLAYKLENALDSDKPFKVNTFFNSGKVEIILRKKASGRWSQIGQPLQGHDTWVPESQLPTVDVKQFPQYRFWRLASKTPITHDVLHYIFEPPYSGLHFQVPVGHHVQFSLRVDLDETEHEEVTRYYTPTNESMKIVDEKDSRLHFLIKTYEKGLMTPALSQLPIMSFLKISNHMGTLKMDTKFQEVENFYLLAAGTGITPMCKLIQAIGKLSQTDSKPSRSVLLLDFNKTQKDIIWNDLLKETTEKNYQLKIVHILSQEDSWNGDKGRVNKDLLEKYIDLKNNPKKMAFVCGPILFNKECERLLNENLQFSKNELCIFEG